MLQQEAYPVIRPPNRASHMGRVKKSASLLRPWAAIVEIAITWNTMNIDNAYSLNLLSWLPDSEINLRNVEWVVKPLQLMTMILSIRCKSLLILSIFSVNKIQAFPVMQISVSNLKSKHAGFNMALDMRPDVFPDSNRLVQLFSVEEFKHRFILYSFEKDFSFRGLHLWPPNQGSAPGPRWGLRSRLLL